VLIGTTSGVLRLRDGGLEPLGLEGHSVTALHASRDALLAGTYGDGLFRSVDGGRSWAHVEAGLTASTFRFVSAELAGTEPTRVFRSADGGRSWEELEGITRIAGYERWYLPYSPRAGAARNAYVCGDRLLVAAEVAGLLRSEDGGRTWVCEPVAGDEDVHHVTAHPDDPDLLYVSLGTASLNQREAVTGASPARATAARAGRSLSPITRARRSSRRSDLIWCWPVLRRRSAVAGALSCPRTAATSGSRLGTASTSRCPTWSSCSSPHPTARSGRSAPLGACCEQHRTTGRGPPHSPRTLRSTSSRSRSPDQSRDGGTRDACRFARQPAATPPAPRYRLCLKALQPSAD